MLRKILICLTVAYAAYLFALTIICFYNFQSEAIDVSYYTQAVQQFSQFKMARIWDDPKRFVWGDHFDPILLVFVPIYWLIKSPYALVVSQVLLVLSGVIPLYLAAKRKLKNFYLALSLVWSYLLFGGLQFGYMYGFHPIVFAPFFLFWLYYFFTKNMRRAYYIFLFLSLCVKEEIAFTMIFFGIYIFLFKKKVKIGLITIITSVLWVFLCFKIIFPHFSISGFLHFGQYGGSLTRFLTNPMEIIDRLSAPDYKLETFLVSYGAFAFLPLLYPPAFVITVPAILEKLLSSNIAALNGFHYSAVITAVILIASIESLVVLLKYKKIRLVAKPIFLTIAILAAAIYFHFSYGYKPFYQPSLHADLIYKTVAAIPENASISAQYQIAARISRPTGKILPSPRFPEKSDYVIIDLKMPVVLTKVETMNSYIQTLIKSREYKLIFQKDGLLVFKKIN